MGPFALFCLAAWFALVTGLLEGAYFWLRPLSLDLAPDVLWMAPVANLPWFLLLAGFILIAGWKSPQWKHVPVAVGWFAFLSAFALLTIKPKLHLVTVVLLALGLGVTALRVVRSRQGLVYRTLRYSLPLVILAVVLSCVGMRFNRARLEQAGLNRLAASKPGASNVLLLVLDTVRSLSLSLYGYEKPTTPQLERWARSGLVFKHAIAPSPWTLPSHSSFFTGVLPHLLSSDWITPLDDSYPTLAEILQDHGYVTAGFVANLTYTSRQYGLSRGFLHYADYSRSVGEFVVSSSIGRSLSKSAWVRRLFGYYDVPGRKSAEDVNKEFISWLDQHENRPFFAFLNYLDAHQPYLAPAEFSRRFGSGRPRRNWLIRRQEHHLHEAAREWGSMSADEVRWEQEEYDATIAYLDDRIGQLLDDLDGRGILNNTIVIITSDHGEQFGEHGNFAHGNSLTRAVLEVPLLVIDRRRWPRGGAVETRPVSLVDLPASVLRLLDLDSELVPGKAWPLNAGDSATGAVFAYVALWEGPSFASVISDSLQYVVTTKGREEVYQFTTDTGDAPNLIGQQSTKSWTAEWRPVLDSMLRRRPISRPSRSGAH